MTIADTYSTIVAMVAGTSGIGACQEELVASLDDSLLPYAQVLVGGASWNEHARGLYRQVRTYTINVYVRPTAEGLVPDEGYKACLAPLYALGRTFVTDTTLGGTVDSIGAGGRGEFSDSGVRVLTSPANEPYHGFTMTLIVTEKAT